MGAGLARTEPRGLESHSASSVSSETRLQGSERSSFYFWSQSIKPLKVTFFKFYFTFSYRQNFTTENCKERYAAVRNATARRERLPPGTPHIFFASFPTGIVSVGAPSCLLCVTLRAFPIRMSSRDASDGDIHHRVDMLEFT